MKRNIITIDEAKCNGCSLCVSACHEGALQLIDGKAKLITDAYCDGLGACLPECPTGAITIEEREADAFDEQAVLSTPVQATTPEFLESQLRQWPVQIKLVPVKAPYLKNARLLVAADCTAFAYANIHNEFMKNKITMIGCPKLDEGDYAEKITAILENNEIKSVTVLRMDVPCCGGISNAVKQALIRSGKMIPWQVVTIGTNGEILAD